jgi:hypothetical protein
MLKKLCFIGPFIALVCLLLVLSACGTAGQRSQTAAPAGTRMATAAPSTATPSPMPTTISTPSPMPTAMPTATASQQDDAAFVAHSGDALVQADEQEYGNSTTIHSAVDRPVASITEPYLSVPPRARGEVLIQNDSANPQTLVSDTPNGFVPFTIAPFTSTTLIFTRTGSFRSHLQGYPDVTLTIFISVPYSS